MLFLSPFPFYSPFYLICSLASLTCITKLPYSVPVRTVFLSLQAISQSPFSCSNTFRVLHETTRCITPLSFRLNPLAFKSQSPSIASVIHAHLLYVELLETNQQLVDITSHILHSQFIRSINCCCTIM